MITVRGPDDEVIEPAPELPPPLTWTWDTDRIPVWDGSPFELGYAVEVLYRPLAGDVAAVTPQS